MAMRSAVIGESSEQLSSLHSSLLVIAVALASSVTTPLVSSWLLLLRAQSYLPEESLAPNLQQFQHTTMARFLDRTP